MSSILTDIGSDIGLNIGSEIIGLDICSYNLFLINLVNLVLVSDLVLDRLFSDFVSDFVSDSIKLDCLKIECCPVSYTHLTLPTNREV